MKRSTLVILAALLVLSPRCLRSNRRRNSGRSLQARSGVMQTIGVTDITISYHRPAMKGRDFPDAPHRWRLARRRSDSRQSERSQARRADRSLPTCGAPAKSHRVSVTDDVVVNGQPLKAGIQPRGDPGQNEWTIIFNNDPGQWGAFSYDAKRRCASTKPQAAGDNQELLDTFDPVTMNSATVNLRWEKVSVPFTVEVKASRRCGRRKRMR
jgi:hypothetical protein